jgi:hypothetical protein
MRKYLWIFVSVFLMTGFFSTESFAQKVTKKMTVRELFKLVPTEYFTPECCDGDVDKFLKTNKSIIDNKNGSMGGAENDGTNGFWFSIFAKPNGGYMAGLYSYNLKWNDFYFLDYKNGKLVNVSKTIPKYSTDNFYEFPRLGTKVEVFKKKYDKPGEPIGVDNSVGIGKYLYSLTWKNGKFVVTK